MYGTCDVPGCTNETSMGWAPIGEQKGKRICKYHFGRHKDPNDEFNLWDVFGFEQPARVNKSVVRAEPKPLQEEPSQQEAQNPSGCRACGAEREAGHTYCPSCAKKLKKIARRQAQSRYWRKEHPVCAPN